MVGSDVNMAREWLHSIHPKSIDSWYIFPMNRLAKEIIMKCQIGRKISKFFGPAKMEICSSSGRTNIGTTSVLYLGISLGIGTGKFIKELVELSNFLHLHMHLTKPEPVGRAKKERLE